MRVVTAQQLHTPLARDTVPGYAVGFFSILASDLSDLSDPGPYHRCQAVVVLPTQLNSKRDSPGLSLLAPLRQDERQHALGHAG